MAMLRQSMLLLGFHMLVFMACATPIVGFVDNQGQLRHPSGLPNTEVLYYFEVPGFQVQLKANGWSCQLTIPQDVSSGHHHYDREKGIVPVDKWLIHRIDVHIEGAASNPEIYTEEQARSLLHFFGPNQQRITNVRHYSAVVYRNILPNVDLRFEIKQEDPAPRAKYSFVLHPGASPQDIRLIYLSGTSHKQGGHRLVFTYPHASIHEGPIACLTSTGQLFSGQYLVEGNVVTYACDQGNSDNVVMIDPVLDYATYFGGSNLENSEGLKIDHQENVYVIGRTGSLTGIATAGAYDQTYNGGAYDVYLLKFNSQFQLLWATYFGGDRVDYGWSIDVDTFGHIYVGGEVYSNGLATPGAQQSYINGLESDGLLARFSANGWLQWCRYYGGLQKDQILSIALDQTGRLVATGYTLSADSIATPGSYMSSYGGKGDIFLAAFDTANGNIFWGTYYGADKDDRGHHVAVSPTNFIYLSGTALSKTGIATPGAQQPNGANLIDAFLAKFHPDGYPIWGTYVAGAYEDRGRDCYIDRDGNILITGFTQSDTGIATPGTWQPYHILGIDSTGYFTLDAFLQKYDTNGKRLWGTYFGDSLSETARSITVNANNDIFIGGATFSPKGIAHGPAWQTTLQGNSDAWFAKFTTDGQLVYSTYFGGSDDEQTGGYGFVLGVDSWNRIYFTSSTLSSDQIATTDAYQATHAGNYDVFIARFIDKCYDAHEPNDAITQAMPLEFTSDLIVYGSLATPGDKDFFSFPAAQPGKQVTATLYSLPANYDLLLYDTNGILVASSTQSGQQPETIQFSTALASSYVLGVVPATTNDVNDSLCYVLHLSIDTFLTSPAMVWPCTLHTAGPNPFADLLHVAFACDQATWLQMRLWQFDARLVVSDYWHASEGINRWTVPTHALPQGLYLLEIVGDNVYSICKVLKQ